MRLTATGIVKTTSSARRIRCGVATTQEKHHKVHGNRVGCYQFCIYQRILAARLGYRKLISMFTFTTPVVGGRWDTSKKNAPKVRRKRFILLLLLLKGD